MSDQRMDTIEKNLRSCIKVGDMIRCKESYLDSSTGIVLEIHECEMWEFDVIRIVWNDGVQEGWSLQEFLELHKVIS